jgi:hypothetical protein
MFHIFKDRGSWSWYYLYCSGYRCVRALRLGCFDGYNNPVGLRELSAKHGWVCYARPDLVTSMDYCEQCALTDVAQPKAEKESNRVYSFEDP